MKVNELGEHSEWIYDQEANDLFTLTRARVFSFVKNKKKKKNSEGEVKEDTTAHYNLRLEENPKWKLLADILDEIHEENKKLPSAQQGKVLIMVRDISTCRTLYSYLSLGAKKLLENKWEQYLSRKAYLRKKSWSSKIRKPSTKVKKTQKANTAQVTIIDLVSKVIKSDTNPSLNSSVTPLKSENSTETDTTTNAPAATSKPKASPSTTRKSNLGGFQAPIKQEKPDDDMEFFSVVDTPHISIQPYENIRVLEEYKPKFVILYDADVGFIRQLEVYKAVSPGVPLRVYFLLYENSVEEQQYLSNLKQENQAFENLIRAREKIILGDDQDDENKRKEEIKANPRTGGALAQYRNKPAKILVDVREFRSKLPSTLFRQVASFILSFNYSFLHSTRRDLK